MTTGNSVGLEGCASLYACPAPVSEAGQTEASHLASLARDRHDQEVEGGVYLFRLGVQRAERKAGSHDLD